MTLLKLARQTSALLALAVMCCTSCKKDEPRVYELLPPEAEDVTGQASLFVSLENSDGRTANEGSLKVIDNNVNSKFLIFDYDPTFYLQLKFAKPQHITSYTLTSANDAPDRDPKDWKISASDDGNTWVDLDTRTAESFSERGETRNYEFTNPKAYTYYKMSITSNGGSSLFQLAEWRVTSIPLND
jgi:hypothetical protein